MEEIIRGKLIKFLSLYFLMMVFQEKKKPKQSKIVKILPCCHLLSFFPLLCFEVTSVLWEEVFVVFLFVLVL